MFSNPAGFRPEDCSSLPSTSKAENLPEKLEEWQKILIENQLLAIPQELTTDLFFDVVSFPVYQSLSNEAKARLKKFLPENVGDSFVERLLDPNAKIGFDNPVKKFHDSLKHGRFDPEFVKKFQDIKQCLCIKHKLHLRKHYSKLLKDLLIRRRSLMKNSAKRAKGERVFHSWENAKVEYKKEKLKKRSLHRVKTILNSIKAQVNEYALSSDDEDISTLPKDPKEYLAVKHAFGPQTSSATLGSNEQQFSTVYNPSFPDLDLHQPSQMNDVKTLINEYKLLRKSDPDHPSLEFGDITLDAIVARSGYQPPVQNKQNLKRNVANNNGQQQVQHPKA